MEVKRNLDVLRDGLERLGSTASDLTDEVLEILKRAGTVRDFELSQLRIVEQLTGIEADAELVTNQLKAERPWADARQLTPALDRINERYTEVRSGLLNRQGVEAQAALARVKTRTGFARLDADQAHRVVRPITEALVDTTADAVSPTLVELRDGFASRIQTAEEAANDRLDEELSKLHAKGDTEAPIVKIETNLRGREIGSREQLRAVLQELEDRLGPPLDEGKRVRIV